MEENDVEDLFNLKKQGSIEYQGGKNLEEFKSSLEQETATLEEKYFDGIPVKNPEKVKDLPAP